MYEEQKTYLKSLCEKFKSFTITVDFCTEKFSG